MDKSDLANPRENSLKLLFGPAPSVDANGKKSMVYIILGSALMSLSVSYAWWLHVRIIDLRQDIYDKRDALFDIATELGALDDPAYRQARRHLNHIARTVEFVSFDILVYIGKNAPSVSNLETDNERLRQAIDETMGWCAKRIVNSLLYETFSGWILIARFRLRGIVTALESRLTEKMRQWLASSYPESVDLVNSLRATPA